MPVDLHYDISGEGHLPPLILSGSLGSTGDAWDWQLSVFNSLFHTIAFDHRGHGRSPEPPGPYSIADLGEDVLALMDKLDIERTHFCGLSLGGMVGIWLGAHAPERIASLTLCCTSAKPGNDQAWADRAATVLEHRSVEPVADAIVARWVTPAFAVTHPDVVAGLRSMLAGCPPDGYAACCGVLDGLDLVEELGQIGAPTLVISGAADQALPLAHQQAIAGGIADARHETIDPGAHLPNVERPDAFSELVAGHVQQHAG
jgi:3-oxoadipate enol-lactonase